jgi:septal ring factor EnvC (AmiA/AmiB activator)
LQNKQALNKELDVWNMSVNSCFTLYSDPVSEKLLICVLRQQQQSLQSAKDKEERTKIALLKWKNSKTVLENLQIQQDNLANERANVKKEKQTILNSAIGRRVAAEEEIRKLQDSAVALESIIVDLERKKKKTQSEIEAKRHFEGQRKLLPWPVEGQLVAKFGKNKHPDFDTFIISNGIKIKTAGSSDVKAVGGGEVIFAGEFRAYGSMVIVDHGGGFYSIYGQLGEIEVNEGQKVKAEEPIGKTQTNGDSVLYFEIRSNGKPQDPMLWLK